MVSKDLLKLCLLSLVLGMACRAKDIDEVNAALKSSTLLELEPYDISILFPVHKVPGLSSKLPLIRESMVPTAVRKLTEGGLLSDSSLMRVIAMRFDPCANKLQIKELGGNCIAQLRLTWQEVLEREGVFRGTKDTAIHTAYSLNNEEAKSLEIALQRLRSAAGKETLSMKLEEHPTLIREGADGPYMHGVLQIIDRYGKSERLTNLAFLRRELDRFPVWEMGHYTRSAEGWVAEVIPTLPSTALKQRFRSSQPVLEVEPVGRLLQLTVPFVPPGTPGSVLDDGRHLVPFRNTFKIENPMLHNPLTLDCGSCHRTAALYSARRESIARGEMRTRPEEFRSEFVGLEPNVSSDPASLHMFSFFEDQPEVTPRIVNETLDILSFLKEKR